MCLSNGLVHAPSLDLRNYLVNVPSQWTGTFIVLWCCPSLSGCIHKMFPVTWCTADPVHCFILYIPRNMHTVFALLCFVVVIHWLIFPYPSGLLHWHCGNLTIAPVAAKQPWLIWINTSCEFIMNDCVTTTKQSTTQPCAYFLGYTVCVTQLNEWDKE